MSNLERDEQAEDRKRWRMLRKLFPAAWTATFRKGDLELYVDDVDRFAAATVDARVVRLDDARKRQLKALLDKESPKRERWSVNGHIVCLVNERNQPVSSHPDGFLTVAFPQAWCNRTGRLSHLVVEAKLAWVRPSRRGRGLGYYCAVAMASYWRDCPVRFPAASKRGVEIEFVADVYSTGGQQLTRILFSELECMYDEWREFGARVETWRISELVDASDDYDAKRTGSYLALKKSSEKRRQCADD